MTKENRVGQFSAMAWALVAAAMAVPATAATVTYTWTASVAGNWSDAANWSSATLPVSSLTDTILEFKPNTAVDWHSPALNNTFQTGGTFEAYQLVLDHAGSTKKRYGLINASGNTTTLSVGAGGISDKSTNYVNIEMNMNAAASQSWEVVSGGSLYIKKNVTADSGVVITKTGAGTLQFQDTTPSGFNGSFVQSGGTIILAGTNQFARLGSGLAVSGSSNLGLQANNNATSDFNTPISFGSFSGMYQIHYNYASNAVVNLKGSLSGNLTSLSGYLGITIGGGNTIRFQADSSGLTSTANAASGQYAIRQRSGTLVVDHANALGTGNSVPVAVGEYNGSTSGSIVSLLTNGYDVSAPIIVPTNSFVNGADKSGMGMAVVGLGQPGAATFSGPVYLQKSSPGYTANEFRLTAPTGGTVTFSGVIQDQGYADQFEISPVTVYGTGTVKVSGNNTYKGTTAVRSGTLLLAHDSAMGTATSSVLLGDAVSGRKTVKAATTATPANGTFTPATNTWSFSTAATFDGVTSFALDDLILVKDSSIYAYNGVYKVTAVDGTGKVTAMVRDESLDTYDEAVYGYTVNVASGTANGGKRFAAARLNTMSAATFNTTANNLNGEIVFVADQVDPTVAILADGARMISRNITVTDNFSTGKSILGGNTADVSEFTGTVTLNKALTVTAASGGEARFSNDIAGSFGITKEGSGKVSFDGNKTYTGVTAVTAGVLEVNGALASTQVDIIAGGTLAGSGNLAGVVVSNGGTLSPGNSPGTMTIAGLTLDAASNLNYDLSANDLTIGAGVNDMIQINGNVTLAGTLNVAVYGGTELSFGTYRLMNYTGTLTNNTLQLAGGLSATRTYQIDTNTAGQVNLVVSAIPEPASLGLLTFGSVLIAGRPRNPRKFMK